MMIGDGGAVVVGEAVVVGWAASFPFAYYWPERPTFAPTTIPTAVLFQVQYPDRDDLVLIGRTKRPDLVFGAVREAAARSGSGRVWLVAAESGDRSPAQIKSLDEIGQIIRRPLPRLALVDGTDAKAMAPTNRPGHKSKSDPAWLMSASVRGVLVAPVEVGGGFSSRSSGSCSGSSDAAAVAAVLSATGSGRQTSKSD